MSLYVVLEDWKAGAFAFTAGELVDDGQVELSKLQAAGLAVLPYVALTMEDPIKAYRGTRSGGRGSKSLVAVFIDRGIIGGGGGTVNNPLTADLSGQGLFGVTRQSRIGLETGLTSPVHAEGLIFYDDSEKTLAVYNDDANVTHQLGQELLIRVYNATGAPLADGAAVYVSGVQTEVTVGGNVARPRVTLARADAFATSRVIGVVTGTIANNSYGYVTNRGFVNGIDLSAFSDGDLLYLSETVAGGFRVGPPPPGNYNAQIGVAADATLTGRLLVLVEVNLANQTGSAAQASTGLEDGGVLSVNGGDPALFDISAGSGEIVDAFTDPSSPDVTFVSWSAFSAQTVTNLATASFTWVGITSAGAIIQIADRDPTPAEARDNIWLGRLGHPNNTSIAAAANRPFGAIQPALTGADLARAIGPFNVSGHIYSANGANLLLDRSAGEIFLYGGGFQTDTRAPNLVELLASTGFAPSYRYRDGSGGWTAQAAGAGVDPAQYDDGSGTLASVPANRWTVQRIQLSATGPSILYYGQQLYNSLALALEGVNDEIELDPALGETIVRGWLVVRGNATALNDTANNAFVSAQNGPGGAQAGGSVGITDHGNLAGLGDDDHTQYKLRSELSVELLGPFTSGNRYDGAANGFGGVTSGFLVAAVIEATERNGSAGQTVISNISVGVDGWALNVEANGAFTGQFVDAVGALQGAGVPAFDPINDPPSAGPFPKHWVIIMRIIQNGANNEISLWANGFEQATTAPGTAYAPRTAAPTVGAGPFGNLAAETLLAGFAYHEGTFTDDQLRAFSFACMAAGDIVDAGLGWDSVYSVKRGAPGATWTPSDGTGITFNRVGAPGSVTRDVPFWG